jgi:hypothetical protein
LVKKGEPIRGVVLEEEGKNEGRGSGGEEEEAKSTGGAKEGGRKSAFRAAG